jgi:drug/metabolite transporter (DMT)-like permease
MAAFFLSEPYTLKEAGAAAVSLFGTVLVAQPEFLFGALAEKDDKITAEERAMAVGVALFGVLAASGAYTTIRKIGKAAHALHTVSYFCMACTIVAIGTPFVIPGQDFVMPYKPIFWFYLACIVSRNNGETGRISRLNHSAGHSGLLCSILARESTSD